jgi:hypothetical protein
MLLGPHLDLYAFQYPLLDIDVSDHLAGKHTERGLELKRLQRGPDAGERGGTERYHVRVGPHEDVADGAGEWVLVVQTGLCAPGWRGSAVVCTRLTCKRITLYDEI